MRAFRVLFVALVLVVTATVNVMGIVRIYGFTVELFVLKEWSGGSWGPETLLGGPQGQTIFTIMLNHGSPFPLLFSSVLSQRLHGTYHNRFNAENIGASSCLR